MSDEEETYTIAMLDTDDALIGEMEISKEEYDFMCFFAKENDMTFDEAFCYFIRIGMSMVSQYVDVEGEEKNDTEE